MSETGCFNPEAGSGSFSISESGSVLKSETGSIKISETGSVKISETGSVNFSARQSYCRITKTKVKFTLKVFDSLSSIDYLNYTTIASSVFSL